MASWFRSLWQKIKRHPIRTALVSIACVLGIVLLIGGYFFNWTWTGFGPYTLPNSNFQREKTLYDWFQLAIIPVALAFGVWWLNRLQQQRDQKLADQRVQVEREAAAKRDQTERDIALDNQRETALQEYIDKMSELMLERDLCKSGEDDEVRTIARVRTLTVLPRLDGERKGSVVQFLYESGLIKDKRIVNLSGADLSQADLLGFILAGANLNEVNLSYANMQFSNLAGANLNIANLFEANLSGADLSGANLSKAIVTDEQLAKARSLKGAIMPDGTPHT